MVVIEVVEGAANSNTIHTRRWMTRDAAIRAIRGVARVVMGVATTVEAGVVEGRAILSTW